MSHPDHQDEPIERQSMHCKRSFAIFKKNRFGRQFLFQMIFYPEWRACCRKGSSVQHSFLQMNCIIWMDLGPACSKEDFPSTETLLPPACLVNIFTSDPPKKLRAGPREDWLRAPRRSLTDWSVAECQSQRTRPTSTPKT